MRYRGAAPCTLTGIGVVCDRPCRPKRSGFSLRWEVPAAEVALWDVLEP